MEKFKFELTEEQAQHVVTVLAKQPYEQVVDIIVSMQQQANEQLNQKEDGEE